MCSFSGATCTSRVRHNADYVPYAKIRFDLYTGYTSGSRQPHSQLQWRFRDKSLWFCGVQLGGVKLPAEFPAARNYKSMVHAGNDRRRQASGGKMAAPC